MPPPSAHEITKLLLAWGGGNECALEQLLPLAFDEQRLAARRYMGQQRPVHILQATALVNEVYLRLVNFRQLHGQNRAHFFAVCAKLMRRVRPQLADSLRLPLRADSIRSVLLRSQFARLACGMAPVRTR